MGPVTGREAVAPVASLGASTFRDEANGSGPLARRPSKAESSSRISLRLRQSAHAQRVGCSSIIGNDLSRSHPTHACRARGRLFRQLRGTIVRGRLGRIKTVEAPRGSDLRSSKV